MIDGEQRELEAELPRQGLEGRVGFFAVGAVVVDVGDLLPLELVRPALLLSDVLDERRGLAPVGHGEVEHPREPPPVGGRRHAVPGGVDDDLVDRGLGDELIGDAGAEGIDEHRILGLEALVALDSLLGVVLRLAFLEGDSDAVDAAVPLVEQVEIVVEAVGGRDPVRRVRPGAIHQERDEHLARRQGGRRQGPGAHRHGQYDGQ